MHNLVNLSDKLERSLLTLDKAGAAHVFGLAGQHESGLEYACELMVMTLEKIGQAWEKGIVSLSQVYLSGIICEELMDELMPPMSPQRIHQPKMGIAVLEDFHVLGKRIIQSTIRAAGYEIEDLGQGIKVADLARKVEELDIKVLLISVLMLPSALRVKELKKVLNGRDTKIVVGGAPFRFDKMLWQEVGADYCGQNPRDAIQIVQQLCESQS